MNKDYKLVPSIRPLKNVAIRTTDIYEKPLAIVTVDLEDVGVYVALTLDGDLDSIKVLQRTLPTEILGVRSI